MLHLPNRGRPAENRKLRDMFGGSLQAKLGITILPLVVLALVLSGYITFRYHVAFIREALGRTARLQADGLAGETERFLATCAEDLRLIAQTARNDAALRDMFAALLATSAVDYRELSFIAQATSDHLVLFAHEKQVYPAAATQAAQVDPNPLSFYGQLVNLAPGQVWVSDVLKVEYPLFAPDHPNQRVLARVIYFGTHLAKTFGGKRGYLLLAVDARDLRNILSAHCAAAVAVWPYAQGTVKGGSYFLDAKGWILFESEDQRQPMAELGTDVARAGYSGTLGNENLAAAFRPDPEHEDYWNMVNAIANASRGIIWLKNRNPLGGGMGDRLLAYAPVRFQGTPERPPTVFGGVAINGRSRLTEAAMFKQVDAIFILILVTVAVFTVAIILLDRVLTRPIRELTAELERIRRDGTAGPVAVGGRDQALRLLGKRINELLEGFAQRTDNVQAVQKEMDDAVLRDRTPVTAADMGLPTSSPDQGALPEIMGIGPKVDRLKQSILKAARTDADVLIMGETGTGKQLTAEAIHRHSRRAGRPFVAINCGELDENLLLDTLFGHVKGAFTEAKTARKGAFVEAEGGILFLDEIQTASPRVQQALLRATAQRKIKPLGSDREWDIDVRLIVATNLDLSRLVEQGGFRQDLYFRLKVITITTPPLRDQPESIPLLVWHYFLQAKAMAQKDKLALTRGALEKMKRYRWSGNVRELINGITRAVVMAEGQQIHAEDILLEGDEDAAPSPAPVRAPEDEAPAPPSPDDAATAALVATYGLNRRQARLYPLIMRQGGISRSAYQALSETGISSRTALYDLQDLVDKGLLRKTGRGPTTRYLPCDAPSHPTGRASSGGAP